MTESDYIQAINRLWPIGDIEAEDAIHMAEDGISSYPTSAKLRCQLGDLIQLSSGEKYRLEDALTSYEKAAGLDPSFSEAHESIGYFCDCVIEDLPRAELAFRKAIQMGAGVASYTGLARVLAELGEDRDPILRLLDDCPQAHSIEISEIRAEIREGLWSRHRVL
jgi:tetratricopeptide (TPR) repeat protein